MKTPGFRLWPLFAGCCVAIAACSQAPGLSGYQYNPNVNVADRQTGPTRYRVLHNFGKGTDGSNPLAGLVDVQGTFYGTTADGGTHKCRTIYCGAGTVFSITAGGVEKVLHSFGKGTDGDLPAAPLIAVKGTLYGTTSGGGTKSACRGGCGTVFSINTTGVEKVLYRFAGGTDGAYPLAGLIDVRGKLYGTTDAGGANDLGTVFSITTGGKEKVLYSFVGGADGANPSAGLIDVSGTLYGTTELGGSEEDGTVFSITAGGIEKVLYSFRGSPDGSRPLAGLIDMGGKLYGTTSGGGAHACKSYAVCDNGTVFSITTGGAEQVLHSFGKGTDGAIPAASLINVDGMLYGTTESGGAVRNCGTQIPYCRGTVFRITTSGNEKVLHSFRNLRDGEQPVAGLIDAQGTLYGTAGVVFALRP